MSKLDQLCVITDEISQDFEHALDVAKSHGCNSVDLRNAWNKNIVLLTDDELHKIKDALEKRHMNVAVISGPFGKCLLPDAAGQTKSEDFMKNPGYNLGFFNRIIEISDVLNTDLIRIFAFAEYGMEDAEKRWQAMKDYLMPYIEKAESKNKILLVENEKGMNVATIAQAKRFFEEIKSPNVKLVLDPGNFFAVGEETTTEAYEHFYENDLVGHIHVKDPKRKTTLGTTFGVVGEGKINYDSLFTQAIKTGYTGFFSLETHTKRKLEEISIKSLENMSKWLEKL